jgi:hypothetical protein
MNAQIQWKKNIYAQIAGQFNKNNIKHAAAHGIDYASDYYGRDADIMIRYKDRKIVRKIIYSVFKQNEIQIKVSHYLWGDWIFGYKVMKDKIFFIEIDTFYHIYYRCVEVTSDKGLSINAEVNTDCFHIDYWNTYAKVVLLKFLGLDFCKLSDKQLKEVTRIVRLYNQCIISPNKFFSDELLHNLNNAITTNNFKNISLLRSKIKLIKIIKKNPVTSFVTFLKMASYVVHREMKVFSIFPVTALSDKATDQIEKITTLLNESFFTKINITNETLNVPSIGDLLKIYINLRKAWEPMTLNIIILNDKTLKSISSNCFIRFIFRFFNILVIDTSKENYQTKDIVIKILEQTVKK